MTKSIIIGTAGHIDHGKTALVRALTGIDADRLPEEKRRGITIDLGFADLDLGDVRIGFVDVPGHERFVKNMLAGAHGIDVVALVIAADESVMPQTREHFDICRLLGVRQGLVVITKKDLVEEDLLQLVRAEAQELVAESFLEDAPVITVSSRTGEGIEELKTALRVAGQQAPSRSSDFVTRLPIDRAFTMRGFGAIVTGTLIAGEISEGEDLEILPGGGHARAPSLGVGFLPGKQVRVRGVQVHAAPVARALAGQRTAINLGGVEAAGLERGMTLTLPGRLRPTQIVDAQVQILADAPRALRSRQRVRVHLGAAEVFARVRVLEAGGTGVPPVNHAQDARATIEPGRSGFAQLRFESPVVGVLGDRFIVRSYSPSRTIGGGTILDAFALKHRSKEVTVARERLSALLGGDRAQQLSSFVENANGLRRADIAARTAWRDEVIEAAAQDALAGAAIVDAEGVLVSRAQVDKLKRAVLEAVSAHHKREPLSRGLGKEILRERHFAHAFAEIFRVVLSQLESAGALVSEKDIVRARAHTRELSDADAQLRVALEKAYRDAALSAPSMSEAFASAGISAAAQTHGRKILQLLIDSGVLVRVVGEMFFHRAALDDLTRKLRAHAAQGRDRSIDVAAFKELAGISRKYAIPLLEYLDRLRVTRREGDRRVIL
jgi:selenocysteine-specific elongation factor